MSQVDTPIIMPTGSNARLRDTSDDEIDREVTTLVRKIRRAEVVDRGLPAPDDEVPSILRRFLDYLEKHV